MCVSVCSLPCLATLWLTSSFRRIDVYDEDKLTKDDYLGGIEVPLESLFESTEAGGVGFCDEEVKVSARAFAFGVPLHPLTISREPAQESEERAAGILGHVL